MNFVLFFLLIFPSIIFAATEYKSLSCSSAGTSIIYVNGVWNTREDAEGSTRVIRELINPLRQKFDSRSVVSVELSYNTSEGKVRDLTQLVRQKLAGQRRFSDLEIDILVAAYIFNLPDFIFYVGQELYLEIEEEKARKIAEENYNSSIDTWKLTSKIMGHLNAGRKVIVVSHSQGGIYSNMAYDQLLRMGIAQETLDKFYGNLQLATVAKSLRAKNSAHITHDNDRAIRELISYGHSVLRPNFFSSIVCGSFLCHELIETYLSTNTTAIGPQQGKGSVSRAFQAIFLNGLEEIAWTLASNDQSCCNGKDGRFYRADYESEPQGFVENSVTIAEDATLNITQETQLCGEISVGSDAELTILDTSTVSGKVSIGSDAKLSISNSSYILGNVTIGRDSELAVADSSFVSNNVTIGERSRLLVLDSSHVDGSVTVSSDVKLSVSNNSHVFGKVSLSKSGSDSEVYLDNFSALSGAEQISVTGDMYLDHSYLTNNRDDLNLQLINHSEELPLYFERSYVEGPSTFNGPIFFTDAYVEGVNEISGTQFSPPDEQTIYGPGVDNAAIFHGTVMNGFYYVARTLDASVVEGKTKIMPNGSWQSTFVNPHVNGLTNVSVIDHVSVSGQVDPNTYLEGALIGGNPNGVIVGPGSRIFGGSSLHGSVVLGPAQFRGYWNGGVNANGDSGYLKSGFVINPPISYEPEPHYENVVLGSPYFDGAQIYNTNISGSPSISGGAQINDSNVGGTSTIIGGRIYNNSFVFGTARVTGSTLDNCNVSCNAIVVNESAMGQSFSCGYHTGQEFDISYTRDLEFNDSEFENLRLKNKAKILEVLEKLDNLRG